MRYLLSLSLLLISTTGFFAQNEVQTFFLDNSFQEVKKVKATYIKEMMPVNETTTDVSIFYLDRAPKMIGQYAMSKGKMVENGTFTYYHYNGEVESEGQFMYGYKSGEWRRFTQDGTEMPSRYYSADMGERIRLHILSKMDD